MAIEGALVIELSRQGGEVTRVAIRSSRPLGAARVLEGKDVPTALAVIPMLYSLCGIAQAGAAAQAATLASGATVVPEVQAAREMLVLLETAREHGLRILLDWPGFLDEVPQPDLPRALNRMLSVAQAALFPERDAFMPVPRLAVNRSALNDLLSELDDVLAQQVFGCDAERWLENVSDAESLRAWASTGASVAARLVERVYRDEWMQLAASAVDFLAPIDVRALEDRLIAADAADFVAAPSLADRCCETGPLARECGQPLVYALREHYGNAMLSRIVARLVELARLPARMRARLVQPESPESDVLSAQSPRPGVAIGQVEAARGRLIHRVELDRGKIRRYQILAPTEWNFHPRGAVAQGLSSLNALDAARLRRQAELFINAVDPCVGYELRLH